MLTDILQMEENKCWERQQGSTSVSWSRSMLTDILQMEEDKKQQSNMSEFCNEDQEKENTFDYGLDTSSKPDECSNTGKSLVRAQKPTGSFQTFDNSLERMRQNYELYNCTSINLLMKEPIPFTYGTDFPAIQCFHIPAVDLFLSKSCNTENILLREQKTISRNMTVSIYRVPSRTNNVPHKSQTGILHANESINLPYSLVAQCCEAENRRQKQKATRRTSTIMVYLELSRKDRVLQYTPTENVVVREAKDFSYDPPFLAAEIDCMSDSCEENEDEDTPGCFNLGSCFRNMRKYFRKKYTRL
ncbi:hypothetical protein NDU88_002196 [Pleurodeles waltl]|uniref:Uncharacterized protein n=1 Tax=Pleurodeles waltl TaxID=8319 RepID=A0AAV7NDA9_PLEWA|nr:hypothetical protein NDU88_002196 [Pleurodeles waltl]